jgi:hypothetical protein
MTVGDERPDAVRHDADAALAILDFAGYADSHRSMIARDRAPFAAVIARWYARAP